MSESETHQRLRQARLMVGFAALNPPYALDIVAHKNKPGPNSLIYSPYATTRKSPGEMTRKLSVIRSRKNSQFFGIVDLRNFRMARLNSRKVG